MLIEDCVRSSEFYAHRTNPVCPGTERLLKELEAEGDARRPLALKISRVSLCHPPFEAEVSPPIGCVLEHVALINEVDSYDAQADAVSMMTLHASKGLEFPVSLS